MSDTIPVYRLGPKASGLTIIGQPQWPIEIAAKICPVFRHLTGNRQHQHDPDCAALDGAECDCF